MATENFTTKPSTRVVMGYHFWLTAGSYSARDRSAPESVCPLLCGLSGLQGGRVPEKPAGDIGGSLGSWRNSQESRGGCRLKPQCGLLPVSL
ncbi:uncharacterized protein BDZ83DRAFT_618038 [Colletotrichum acutatum]|uniref:Uncharacterized protein n=1 Tax=Glomerella acutata TaxID=27357 RepID=A0AAD8XGY1_GLOAC|nr:uncharacterized protein BDZ83DRAFT_618038 [Colletotrichum acutatum]KAK1725896.1 hypothetical protein BDZ83DRAFT_618038 [Colletotrichum acutatum]